MRVCVCACVYVHVHMCTTGCSGLNLLPKRNRGYNIRSCEIKGIPLRIWTNMIRQIRGRVSEDPKERDGWHFHQTLGLSLGLSNDCNEFLARAKESSIHGGIVWWTPKVLDWVHSIAFLSVYFGSSNTFIFGHTKVIKMWSPSVSSKESSYGKEIDK